MRCGLRWRGCGDDADMRESLVAKGAGALPGAFHRHADCQGDCARVSGPDVADSVTPSARPRFVVGTSRDFAQSSIHPTRRRDRGGSRAHGQFPRAVTQPPSTLTAAKPTSSCASVSCQASNSSQPSAAGIALDLARKAWNRRSWPKAQSRRSRPRGAPVSMYRECSACDNCKESDRAPSVMPRNSNTTSVCSPVSRLSINSALSSPIAYSGGLSGGA